MLSGGEFVRLSLEEDLFSTRIMKEHALFMAAGFVPKDACFIQQALEFQRQFECILAEAIGLSQGVISKEVIKSGELVTPFTLSAECVTQAFTGIPIRMDLTQAEMGLMSGNLMMSPTPMLEQRVYLLNQNALLLTTGLIQFKSRVLSEVAAGRIFTHNYPSLVDHIRDEAEFYRQTLCQLQNGDHPHNTVPEALEFELFWNRIMAEHANFIRGLLDPSEEELISIANSFVIEFNRLIERVREAINNPEIFPEVTLESLQAVERMRAFATQATQGLVENKIKSIILPLISDHILRETSHFLRHLRMFEHMC